MVTLQNRLILWFGALGLAVAVTMVSVVFYLLENEMDKESSRIEDILRADLKERLTAIHADFNLYLERELARIDHDAINFVSRSDVRIFLEKGQTDPLAGKLSSFIEDSGLDFALLLDTAGIVVASASGETDQIRMGDYLKGEGFLTTILDRQVETQPPEGPLVSDLAAYRPGFFELLSPETEPVASVETYGPLNIRGVINDFGEQLGYLLVGKSYYQQQKESKPRFERFPEPVVGYYSGRPHFTLGVDGTPGALSDDEIREISSLPDGKLLQLPIGKTDYLFQCNDLSILGSKRGPVHCVGKALVLAQKVLHRVASVSTQARRAVFKAFIVVALLSLIMFLLLTRVIAERISAPIQTLSHAFSRFSEGELSERIPSAEGIVEIDQLISSAESFRQVVVEHARVQYNLASANSELEAAFSAAEQANEAKSAFIASMSHEMRTPLNAVIGFAEILTTKLESLGDTQSESHARHIREAGENILNIVEKVIAYSELVGRTQADIHCVDLGEILAQVRESVRGKVDEKKLTLACCYKNYRVRGEPAMLRQALLNILGNSISYVAPGGAVAIDCSPCGANFLRVTITDNGPGFPPGKEDSAFLAFERLDQTSGPISGVGLGLTIARYLVEAMGGKVGINSEYRDGAQVWLELPLSPADDSLGEEALP